ncbi:hypothetical protein JL193_09470 [Polaribacter batillariae]|uniref:Uncharacterized protein n=1 Tax=Polaribacter batillariae TaxID=2808900 RepID=A0ABX7SU70_9FLAO|nr:hypothetical protein [Polaribacter batillariae]QTD36389.1 hypothetical protein JL193_09470 [Polaribacter batillariae]
MFFSCSSDDDPITEPQEEPFTVELIATNTNANIDEVTIFEVKTNRPFISITHSTDNFTTSRTVSKSQGDSFGTSLTLYVDTANLGNITYSIRVVDANNNQITATSTLSFTVEKGNALHIKEVLVNNFYDKDNTWDTEFSNIDVNRLADVFFSLSKPHVDLFTGQRYKALWYKSAVKENQGDLTWNFSQENLYIDPNALIHFGLADDDGGGVGQDLLLGPPFEKEINLAQYSSSQPNNITLEDTSINLDVDFAVEW